MNAKDKRKAEAVADLRAILAPGDIIYTNVAHVSPSGMTRWIDLYKLVPDDRIYLSGYAAAVLDEPAPHTQKHGGVKATGCGMDMGFHLVYNLAWVLFHDDPRWTDANSTKDAGYALTQRWL
jgi:hypothetical protein